MSERILITGARGSLGTALGEALRGSDVIATDIDSLDVRDPSAVETACDWFRPTLVYHLAAAKHAPEGELDPAAVVATNVLGTRNVLEAAGDARVVVASTCKAADPETVYGASKLLAERMTLNAGQTVARFYNVPESSGNVFALWAGLDADEPIPYTDCWRYFITLERAVDLLLRCATLPPGRYTVHSGGPQHMRDVAAEAYPGRQLVEIPRRRGDRARELRHAASEKLVLLADGIEAIECAHDPVREAVAA